MVIDVKNSDLKFSKASLRKDVYSVVKLPSF